ncbi:hypothetical protein AB834_05120 [PVC group bacterium (ex Bugula neritina AB1)]|nr:hypothetical protein AB834_05120 [PVC group bacterium (ex Bugula neritina AB1)]
MRFKLVFLCYFFFNLFSYFQPSYLLAKDDEEQEKLRKFTHLETLYPIPFASYERVQTHSIKSLGGIYNADSAKKEINSLYDIDNVKVKGSLVVGEFIPEVNDSSFLATAMDPSQSFVHLTDYELKFNKNPASIRFGSSSTGLSTNSDLSHLHLYHKGPIHFQTNYNGPTNQYNYVPTFNGSGTVKLYSNVWLSQKTSFIFSNNPSLDKSLAPKMTLKKIDQGNFAEGIIFDINSTNEGSFYISNNNDVNFSINPSTSEVKVKYYLNVDGRIKSYGEPLVPTGSVVMFCGSSIPEGWSICDGSIVDGYLTPNLVGRFLRGSASASKTPVLGGGYPHYHDIPAGEVDLSVLPHSVSSQGYFENKVTSNPWPVSTTNSNHTLPHTSDIRMATLDTAVSEGGYRKAFTRQSILLLNNTGSSIPLARRIYGGGDEWSISKASSLAIGGTWKPKGDSGELFHRHILSNRYFDVNIPESAMTSTGSKMNIPFTSTSANEWLPPYADIVFIVKLP